MDHAWTNRPTAFEGHWGGGGSVPKTAEWNSGYSQTDVETAAPFGLVVGTIKFFDHGLPVPVVAAALLTPSLRLLVGALRELQSIHHSNWVYEDSLTHWVYEDPLTYKKYIGK